MNQTIQLAWKTPPLTQNQVRRLHYRDEAKRKKTIAGEATTSIRRAKTQPMAAAEVTLHYRPSTWRRFDADGLAPTLKAILDALVSCGVLEDDSFRYVPHVGVTILPPQPGVPASMWLTLEEVY